MTTSRLAVAAFILAIAVAWLYGPKILKSNQDAHEQVATYLKQACEDRGNGDVVGDLPIPADGYLISSPLSHISHPLSNSMPFYHEGVHYVEYSQAAYKGEKVLKRAGVHGESRSYAARPIESKFIRVSLEEIGRPNCDVYNRHPHQSREILPEHCLGYEELASEEELLSRFELRHHKLTDECGPVPVPWAVTEVIDRYEDKVVASTHHYLICLTKLVGTAGRGFGACLGHTKQSPQLFLCPESNRKSRISESRVRTSSFRGANPLIGEGGAD